jgi:LPS-assembly protein
MPRTLTRCRLACLASLFLVIGPVGAAETEGSCPPNVYTKRAPTPLPAGAVEDAIHVRADRMAVAADGANVFSGNVELQYGEQTVFADEIVYDKVKDEFEARGNVTLLSRGGDAVETPLLRLQRQAGTGYADAAILTFAGQNARGQARRILFEGRERTRLEGAQYTTCPPGQESWFLSAGSIELDYSEDTGTARNATVSFMNLPVFYWPYMTFPISGQRKSGLLPPRVGNTSNSGSFIAIPYYFNIAPPLDATVTARYYSRRGLLWQNEGRYLGERFNGVLEAEYIADDQLFDDSRSALRYRHNHTLGRHWWGNIDFNTVSDKDYFVDFSDSPTRMAQTHLPQLVELNYAGARTRITARTLNYETVDEAIPAADRPYERLPQLLFSAQLPHLPSRPRYGVDGEFVSFERDVGLAGDRLDLRPAVSLPLRNTFGFITPTVAARHTAYRLRGVTDDVEPTRTLGVFSLDSGLIFERERRHGSRGFTQTLEPRLFYLYVPYENQDELPNFDTALPDFSFDNLFRENRFVGADRVGDANQVTAALTTRLLDETGRERLRASIGQIYHFADRRVTLTPGLTETRGYSDVAAEARAQLARRWYLRTDLEWDPRDGTTRDSSIYLQFRPAANKIINVGHRYTQDEQEQIDVSTQWPVGRRWTLAARSNYSVWEDTNIDSYAGFQYHACCWVGRLYARHYLVRDQGQVDSVMFEFEITGLASLGQSPVSPLRENAFMLGD